MTIAIILQGREGAVFTASPDELVESVVARLAEKRIGALPVVENGEVLGTASYLGLPRMVEQGQLKGEHLSFFTRSQEVLGDGPGKAVTHRYRGVLRQDELRFTLESGGGHSVHAPVAFVARRAEPK